MRRIQVIALLLICGKAAPETADDGIASGNGKELQLSRNLLGTWVINHDLTKRTWGSKQETPKYLGKVTYRKESSVLKLLAPEARTLVLKHNLKCYLAGYMRIHNSNTDVPFMVTLVKGNPAVLLFYDRNGIKRSHVVVQLASLIPAKDSRLDLLFIGGDLLTNSYSCFEREIRKDGGTQKT